MRDLGLDYEAAGHGIQSAIRFEMTKIGFPDSGMLVNFLKHLRVAVDMRASDTHGLASLLIEKGLISGEEYAEAMRLAANEELARYEDHIREAYGLPKGASFR